MVGANRGSSATTASTLWSKQLMWMVAPEVASSAGSQAEAMPLLTL
jgi:hypothetical protein